jgi:hypothetical protein
VIGLAEWVGGGRGVCCDKKGEESTNALRRFFFVFGVLEADKELAGIEWWVGGLVCWKLSSRQIGRVRLKLLKSE